MVILTPPVKFPQPYSVFAPHQLWPGGRAQCPCSRHTGGRKGTVLWGRRAWEPREGVLGWVGEWAPLLRGQGRLQQVQADPAPPGLECGLW